MDSSSNLATRHSAGGAGSHDQQVAAFVMHTTWVRHASGGRPKQINSKGQAEVK